MKNGSAIGYMIIAARLVGLTAEKIKELDRAMYVVMDEHTEEEAERVYQNT